MAKTRRKGPPGKEFVRRPDRDRRVRQSDRIARVLGVLQLIESRGRWTAKTISEELKCSERTVYRDLEVLEFAGVPWFFSEQDQCYRVRADYQFPVPALTTDDAIGQAVATAITRAPGLNIGPGASSTTRKLAAVSSDQTREILVDISRVVEVLDLKLVDHSRHLDMIRTIQHALLEKKRIVGGYESPYEQKRRRLDIHPYRLCLVKQAWYLVGVIDKEKEAKTLTFRVARFKSLRVSDKQANVPPEFSLREHFGNAWSVFRGDESFEIKLRFEPQAARIVTETIWHETQSCKKHKDGRATLTFTVDGLDEVLNWILSWTGQVIVLSPRELRVRYGDLLRAGISMNIE